MFISNIIGSKESNTQFDKNEDERRDYRWNPTESTTMTIKRIHNDPLLQYILNHHNQININNDNNNDSTVDFINNDGGSSPSTTLLSSSSSSSTFFLFNQYQSNQSDLNLIPLVSSSPSFLDVTINVSGNHHQMMVSRSLPILILLSSLLIFLILATIIGNVFVISAVIWERSLRSVGNYLVVSLAITDLFVACLVMPIGAIYQVMGEWHLGIKLCELWTFIDVLCCTTSIFHLLAIACDRLWAVTNVDYIHRRKTKHVCIGIAIIWLFSAFISLGPMLGWKDSEFEQRIVERHECMISQDISYQLFATIASFYAPSILLLLQYYRIYQVAKTRLKLKKQRYEKYRIRRRPSFYRTRKESEIKEFPRVSHRVSLNTNEEFFSSSAIMPPPSSTSGVYSSSTTTDYTTATTNTTLSTDRTSSVISLSPPILLKPPIISGSVGVPQHQQMITINDHNQQQTTAISTPTTIGKRFSIVQFFNNSQQRRSDNLDGEKFTMAHFDDFDNNDLRSNESSIDESTIIVTGGQPSTGIVVYVDDYGSTINSSSGENGISYYQDTDFPLQEEEEEDEFIDSPVDDIAVDVTDPDGEEHDSAIDEEISIRQDESPDNLDIRVNNKIDNRESPNSRSNFLTPPPEQVDIEDFTLRRKPSINSHSNQSPNHQSLQRRKSSLSQNHRRGSNHHNNHNHHPHQKKHKRRRIRKLKFRSKILRLDNGQQKQQESKQETKAAKTLTIITGVFIICWLPFFVLALVIPLCGNNCYINRYLFDFAIWLGWANSTLNPFLYTIFSPDFRNAFKKLLKRIKKKR